MAELKKAISKGQGMLEEGQLIIKIKGKVHGGGEEVCEAAKLKDREEELQFDVFCPGPFHSK